MRRSAEQRYFRETCREDRYSVCSVHHPNAGPVDCADKIALRGGKWNLIVVRTLRGQASRVDVDYYLSGRGAGHVRYARTTPLCSLLVKPHSSVDYHLMVF